MGIPIIRGRNSGVWRLPGSDFTRTNGRWQGTRPFACGGNPFLVIPAEGSRDTELPFMRVFEVAVQHNPKSISTFRVSYCDETTYDETKANRYPRGLVAVGTSLQSGNINIRTFDKATAQKQITSIPVVYISGTKTYVSYHGLKNAELRTRAAASPPFLPPAAEIIWYDFSAVEGPLADEIQKNIRLQITTRWVNLPAGEEAGGYWRRTDNWSAIQVPEILSLYGTESPIVT